VGVDLRPWPQLMAHTSSPEQRSSDQLLWLGGAVVALVGVTWLLLDQPWSAVQSAPQTVTSVGSTMRPAATTPRQPAQAAPAEPELDDALRLARLALDAGMLLEPAGFGAWDLYGRALDEQPEHTAARAGLARVADALVERGRTALQQGRTEDASDLAALIQRRMPAHAGARELAEEIAARAIAERNTDPALPVAGPTVDPPGGTGTPRTAPSADPVPALHAQFERALAEGRLLAPGPDGAKTLLATLSTVAPEHEATDDARERLFERFIALAERATDELDTQAAYTWIDEAAVLGIHADSVTAVRATLEARLIAAEASRLVAASDLTLVQYVPPEYPSRAVARGTEGWVDVEFVVDTEGRTRDVVVTGASHPSLFHDAALAAVREWRFAPRTFLSQPISQRSFTRIRFALE
jgi:TonB family protein